MGSEFFKLGKFVFIFSIFIGKTVAYGFSGISLGGAFSDPLQFLNGDIANAMVTTLGRVLDHRPFEPATPLGTQLGLDFGIQVVLVQVPDLLSAALATQGVDISTPPVLPSLTELNLHKGISNCVDIGGSALSFQGYLTWAVDLKWVVFNPEEGLTWAIRLSRSSTHIPLGDVSYLSQSIGLAVDTVTWTPELVVSRKLDFADPYMGIGYQYATGQLSIINNTGIDIPGLDPVNGNGGGLLAFLGLSLKVPNIGFRLTLEGAYSPAGFNSIGTKLGFSF